MNISCVNHDIGCKFTIIILIAMDKNEQKWSKI